MRKARWLVSLKFLGLTVLCYFLYSGLSIVITTSSIQTLAWLSILPLLVVFGYQLYKNPPKLTSNTQTRLQAAYPTTINPECLSFKEGNTHFALSYIEVTIKTYNDTQTLLSALHRALNFVDQLTLAVARPITGEPRIHLILRTPAPKTNNLVQKSVVATKAITDTLKEQGIEAKRICDELSGEELYCMNFLGKEFFEEHHLHAKNGVMHAQLQMSPHRQLVAAEISLDKLSTCGGVLNKWRQTPPGLLLLYLTPFPKESIQSRLEKYAIDCPELLQLYRTLGEEAAQLPNLEPSHQEAIAEIAVLAQGYREGLWLCKGYLISTPQDITPLANLLDSTITLVDCQRFIEIITNTPSSAASSRLLSTSYTVRLLTSPQQESIPETSPPQHERLTQPSPRREP